MKKSLLQETSRKLCGKRVSGITKPMTNHVFYRNKCEKALSTTNFISFSKGKEVAAINYPFGQRCRYMSSSAKLMDLLDEDISEETLAPLDENTSLKSSESEQSLLSLLSDDDDLSNASLSSTESEKTSPKKRKRKVKKRMSKPGKSNLIAKTNAPTQQSKANAHLLFDNIAPHVDRNVLNQILERMKDFEQQLESELQVLEGDSISKASARQKKTLTKKKLKEYKTLLGEIDAFYSSSKPKGRGKKKQLDVLAELPWVKSLIAQFFGGIANQSNDESGNAPAPLSLDFVWRDQKFTPNMNRKSKKEDIAILMHAREMSLESPLFWSNNQRRKADTDSKQKHQEHFEKPAEKLEEEATALATLLAFRLPAESYRNVIELFKTYSDNVSQNMEQDNDEDIDSPQGERLEVMKMILPNLGKESGFHLHLIAMEVAEFFYVDIPKQTRGDSSLEESLSEDNVNNLPLSSLGRSDSRINEAWDQWNEVRDELADLFLSAQLKYVRLQKAVRKGEVEKGEKKKKTEKKEDTSVEENEIRNIMIKYSSDAHQRAEDLIAELNRLRTTEDGDLVGINPADRTRVGRAPRGAHLQFECLLLKNDFGSYSNFESATLADMEEIEIIKPIDEIEERIPNARRTIFVDNLPIDMTREELEYLYSRCGKIESIELFNLRPDLDPGELSAKQTQARRKKNRMSGKKGATKVRNVRSPVYAIIKFENDEGHKRATLDALRIFGMVIRKFQAKTHPARNLNTLFLENIPDQLFAMDLEEKLSQLLHPQMYVSLGPEHHMNAQVKSCELQFPTFETAYYAYQQLQQLEFDSDEEIQIQWMKTPDNAMAYWTRDFCPNTL
ncbi:hypothetical protein CTEN210_11686 [Chaetoceros tenuissimus]|uniref:RRM domain-containing protein n=1 Tax=Chaetoceros tenuissimus TaxID=426638 RepID=A0AAD3D2A4_9STRA|nr:hypothetical protein CTEN210_11686 [Chaetoceros tenuissimus]